MTRRTLSAVLLVLTAVAFAPSANAEVTRTIRVEIPRATEAVAIENLAGTLKIVPGNGDTIVAVATVHAESEELAAAVRFERVDGSGRAAYRVRYPYDRVGTFRYSGGNGDGNSGGFGFHGGSTTNTTYDDHRVKVSSKSGSRLYADLEIEVPRRAVDVKFRNVAGRMDAREIEGKLGFEVASGRIVLSKIRGESEAESGSGDIEGSEIEGTLDVATGSGDCTVRGFKGESLSLESGSGDLHADAPVATKISAETGSGDIRVLDADAEKFVGATGSGDIDFGANGGLLASVTAETGSGDVHLRLPRDASFVVNADQGSGDITSRFADAQPIVRGREVVGYRRGDGRCKIEVETGSGDLVVEPGD